MIKSFSVPQNQNMVRAYVFLWILLRFLSVRLRHYLNIISSMVQYSKDSSTHFAACGGEPACRQAGKSPRKNLKMRRSCTDDNFKFFFGGT